jgi:uracil-DNA glycosylase
MTYNHLILEELNPKYTKLQNRHGDSRYDPIVGAGDIKNPQVVFVFMNPTARNISAHKSWNGLKAPWIGTKGVWSFFSQLGLFSPALGSRIDETPPEEWNYEYALDVYNEVKAQNFYITNLAKCTQPDARHLKNAVFRDYKPLFDKEIITINPEVIILFGNQVSSVALEQSISVSKVRRKRFDYVVGDKSYKAYSVYYPMGQGRRNIGKAVEDVRYVMDRSL